MRAILIVLALAAPARAERVNPLAGQPCACRRHHERDAIELAAGVWRGALTLHAGYQLSERWGFDVDAADALLTGLNRDLHDGLVNGPRETWVRYALVATAEGGVADGRAALSGALGLRIELAPFLTLDVGARALVTRDQRALGVALALGWRISG